jgi:hyaluronan synthase
LKYEARIGRAGAIIPVALIIAALLFWAVQHVIGIFSTVLAHNGRIMWVWLFAFAWLFVEMTMCLFERAWKTTERQQRGLDSAYLVVAVPAYNEDPAALRECIASMLRQTRPPDLIWVTDDGSTEDYTDIREWFYMTATRAGVRPVWHRQANAGKRHAQGAAIAATPEADYYLTVDSDAILDREAIREGLKPFARADVQSVGGVVMVANQVNMLTRLTDLWFVIGQLVDRSSMSAVGGVLVNSGALALYRGELLRENLDGYLNELFFGRRIETSDDSLFTIYAILKGKAVQQHTSFAFTFMPEKYSHHRRQYLRWMRGAFIRSWWRFKYLPLDRPSYWIHLLGWVQLVLSTVTFTALFIFGTVRAPASAPFLLSIPLLVGYGQGLRYFMIKRSDISFRQQVGMYLLTPVVILYGFFVLRAIRFYAMATCLKTGWGTRDTIEIRSEVQETPEIVPETEESNA